MATICHESEKPVQTLRKDIEQKTKPFIISSERQLLELRGDFTELVRVTTEPGEQNALNGWYVYERTAGEGNRFIRKRATFSMIEVISCGNGYLRFDRNLGILPNAFEMNYRPVGPNNKEFEVLKTKLTDVGEWQ